MPTVQLPNGKIAQFPDGMAPADIQKAIESDPNSGALPAGATGPLPGVPKPPQPQMQASALGYAVPAAQAVKDTAIGAGKGALSTLNGIGTMITPNAMLRAAGQDPAAETAKANRITAPTNTAQKIGRGAEQVGEFMIPGMGEEGAATKGAELVPKLGRFAKPLVRTLYSAGTSGLVNKAQGGSFTTGALAGGAGGVASEGFRAAAPYIAESALGVRGADRGFGRNTGRAILDETTGTNARSIADQAQDKITNYSNALDNLLSKSTDVDLTPARQTAADALSVAGSRNNPETIKRTSQIGDLLKYEGGKPPAPQPPTPKVIPGFGTAAARPPAVNSALIPPSVPATRARALKQGLGELRGSWNPAVPNTFADASVGNTYHTLDNSIEQAAPGSSLYDQKISSLMPVAARANATDLNANAMQRIMGRLTRPTGALITSGLGATEGYHRNGVPGAVAGAGLGLVAPELIGSPTFQMFLARQLNNGITPTVDALVGGGLQANRKNLYGSK